MQGDGPQQGRLVLLLAGLLQGVKNVLRSGCSRLLSVDTYAVSAWKWIPLPEPLLFACTRRKPGQPTKLSTTGSIAPAEEGYVASSPFAHYPHHTSEFQPTFANVL